jgi:superfamily II DNA/RNA helicase
MIFRPDYLHLRQVHRDLGAPPLLAMTATAPPVVRADIERQLLGDAGAMRVLAGDTFRANLHLRAYRVRDDDARQALLLRLLRSVQGSGIIYARSRRRCEELAATLRQAGFAAAHYHAGIDNRAEVQDRFMRNDVRVIVATIAFGMGIDKGDIRFIVHDGLPSSLEGYYQEIGRAGRDGKPAHCLLIYAGCRWRTLRQWCLAGRRKTWCATGPWDARCCWSGSPRPATRRRASPTCWPAAPRSRKSASPPSPPTPPRANAATATWPRTWAAQRASSAAYATTAAAGLRVQLDDFDRQARTVLLALADQGWGRRTVDAPAARRPGRGRAARSRPNSTARWQRGTNAASAS